MMNTIRIRTEVLKAATKWIMAVFILCIATSAQAATFTLINSNPANNAVDVSRTDSLSLTFSTNLDPRSASRNGVLLQSSATGIQQVSLSVSGPVLTIRPLTPLLPFTRYTLSISLLVGSNGEQPESTPVLTFKTRDATWQAEQQVYNVALGQWNTVTATNSSGVRFIAWMQPNNPGVGYDVWGVRQIPGRVPSDPVLIARFPNSEIFEVKIFIDDAGNGFVSWITDTPPNPAHVWVARFTTSNGWSTPQIINGNSKLTGGDVHIAFDNAGNALALWKEHNCCGGLSYQRIIASRFTVNNGWSKPVHLDDSASLFWGKIDIEMDKAGNAYATWLDLKSTTQLFPELMVSRYVLNNGWSTPQAVATESASHTDGYQVLAVNPRGEALLIWADDYGVSIARADNAGNWTPSMVIDSSNTYAPTQAVLLDDGQAFAAFGNGLMNFTPEKGQWSKHPLQTDGSTTQGGDVSIIADASGNALAAWVQVIDHIPALYTKRYRSHWGWLGTVRMDMHNPSVGAELMELAPQASGSAVLSWLQSAGDASQDLRAARFE